MCVSESQAWGVDWKVEGGALTTDKQNISLYILPTWAFASMLQIQLFLNIWP